MNISRSLVKEKHKKTYSHYLSPDEQMVYFTTFSKTYLFRRFVWWFVFPGILIIIATVLIFYFLLNMELLYGFLLGYAFSFLLSLIKVYFLSKGTQYILTNRRLIIQRGYFNVSLISVAYDKITHVEVRQSIFERYVFKYGRVIVHNAGSKNREIVLYFLDSPIKFKNLLEKLVDENSYDNNKKIAFRRGRLFENSL